MQKYSDPLPGRHGYLTNPPSYGANGVLAFCDLTRKIARKWNQLQAREIARDFSRQTTKCS